MTISAQLKAWRARRKLSQSQAAAELDMSVRTLQDWEHGRSQPKGFTRAALLDRISLKPIPQPKNNNPVQKKG